jgi:uncharacterized pyridoxamine 5'-phosphate oxidase family protein
MKEYRTLYQRLKDEYRVKLIENKNKWQYIAVEAETALNENKFVVDLTISQLGYICDMCEVNSWDKIYTIFNED